MTSFACFNDLSIQPLCTSEESAEQRVHDFLVMFKTVREHTKITKVRHYGNLTTILLSPTKTLQDYINSHTKQPAMMALLGIFTQPQVDMEDDILLQTYLDTTVGVKRENNVVSSADGFNAAYSQNTFCVGFRSSFFWERDFFELIVSSNTKKKNVNWACISVPFSNNNDNREQIFDSWLQDRHVELVTTNLNPEQKQIKVRDDHGKTELIEHARILNQNCFVEGVVSSLPFKPHFREYIYKVYDDGMIDIVLWWKDKGFSLRVKTTGRNISETREIAQKLRDEFGKRK